MTDEQKNEVVNAVISAVLALVMVIAGIFGYNAWTVQPAIEDIETAALVEKATRMDQIAQVEQNALLAQVAQVEPRGIPVDLNNLRATTLSVAKTSTFNGATTFTAGDITAAEIANVERAVNLPLHSLIECTTDAGANFDFTSGADAFPDLINSATNGLGFGLVFDDTGGSVDTAYVCGQVMVPPDYASGGSIRVAALKDSHTITNTEVINCQGSINGAALGVLGTATVTASAAGNYDCTPTLTGLAAGNALGVTLYITSSGTVDDAVTLKALEFVYTATQ